VKTNRRGFVFLVWVVVLADRIRWTAGLTCCAAGFEVALTLLLDGVAGVCLFSLFPVDVLAFIDSTSLDQKHNIPIQIARKIRLRTSSTLTLSSLRYRSSDITLPTRRHLCAVQLIVSSYIFLCETLRLFTCWRAVYATARSLCVLEALGVAGLFGRDTLIDAGAVVCSVVRGLFVFDGIGGCGVTGGGVGLV
jgi:hypothetical protein